MKNIDESNLRGEYKLNIYFKYALISLRYHLSVHDINKTHLDKLDSLAKSYLKRWLNIPLRGASENSLSTIQRGTHRELCSDAVKGR